MLGDGWRIFDGARHLAKYPTDRTVVVSLLGDSHQRHLMARSPMRAGIHIQQDAEPTVELMKFCRLASHDPLT